jgi:hypothetical protein
MGLCPLLVDTYRRYKADTGRFVQWLAENARTTGTVDDIFEAGAASNKNNGRKKGKRRTKLKATHEVSVNSFIRLANAIVAPVNTRIPRSILSTLRDVIHARKCCAAWYRAHQAEETKSTDVHNEGHRHFISVLEEVYETLKPFEMMADKNDKNNENVDVPKMSNMFEYLEIEEASDWDPTAGTMPNPPKKKASQDTYNMETSAEDISFALYCFIKDLTDIRIFVRRSWREYKHGHTTLNTAAVIMNTAIKVFWRLNEAFVESFPQFAEHGDIIKFLYQGYLDPNSKATIERNEEGFASYDFDGMRLSSKTFFCDHVLFIVKSFFGASEVPFHQEGVIKQWTEDETVLLKCLSLLGMEDFINRKAPAEYRKHFILGVDQIFQAVGIMREEKKFPTWAIFAVQLFVDTLRELKGRTEQCFSEFQRNADIIKHAITRCIEFGKSNKVNHWHRFNDEGVQNCSNYVKHISENDFIQEGLEVFFEGNPAKIKKYSWGPFFILKNHPMLCGLLIQDVLVKYHRMGTRLAGDQGPLRCAIHLSQAAHIVGSSYVPTDLKWADLDYIVGKYGDSWLFTGERPKTLRSCVIQLGLSFGDNLSMYSRNKKMETDSRIMKRIKNRGEDPGPRFLKRQLMCISRYAQLSERIEGKKCMLSRAAEDPGVMLEMLVNKYLDTEDVNRSADPYNEKKTKEHRIMTPLQSFTVFKTALKADDFPLRFNMIDLNERCVELFRRIQRVCLERSPLDYPLDQYGADKDLVAVLGHMFIGIANSEITQFSRFRDACELLAEVINKDGNVEYLKAEAWTGIVSGTAVSLKDDPEELENPIHDQVPIMIRDAMENLSPIELEKLKIRNAHS